MFASVKLMAWLLIEIPKVKAATVIVDGPVLVSDTSNAPEPPAAAVTGCSETIVPPCAPTDKKRPKAKAEIKFLMIRLLLESPAYSRERSADPRSYYLYISNIHHSVTVHV